LGVGDQERRAMTPETQEWVRIQVCEIYANSCAAIMRYPDEKFRNAALADWDHTRDLLIDAILAYLARVLNERAEAEIEGELQ
jgi:hypothetical protein